MDSAERAAFLERQSAEYADAKARAGFWSSDEAPQRARAEIRSLLEDHDGASLHEFLRGADASGRTVGHLWVGSVPGERPDPRVRWLFQITVAESLRGQGYGRALLAAAEDRLRSCGVRELRLNVFAHNRVAIALYESAGYEVTSRAPRNLEMRKRLA